MIHTLIDTYALFDRATTYFNNEGLDTEPRALYRCLEGVCEDIGTASFMTEVFAKETLETSDALGLQEKWQEDGMSLMTIGAFQQAIDVANNCVALSQEFSTGRQLDTEVGSHEWFVALTVDSEEFAAYMRAPVDK